jgi:hypothetical protein
MAGMLHDLGKIAIPTELLSKSGKLTPLEFALIKTHPQVAFNILEPITLPGQTAMIILQHHERVDGSGYPQGLKGNEILLEARILGVADVMESMCSHRPYRPSLGLEETLDELARNKGKLYGQDLPALSDKPSVRFPMSITPLGPLVPLGDLGQAQGNFFHTSPLSQKSGSKPGEWAKWLAKGNRALVHLGTASLAGLLIISSLKGL